MSFVWLIAFDEESFLLIDEHPDESISFVNYRSGRLIESGSLLRAVQSALPQDVNAES